MLGALFLGLGWIIYVGILLFGSIKWLPISERERKHPWLFLFVHLFTTVGIIFISVYLTRSYLDYGRRDDWMKPINIWLMTPLSFHFAYRMQELVQLLLSTSTVFKCVMLVAGLYGSYASGRWFEFIAILITSPLMFIGWD